MGQARRRRTRCPWGGVALNHRPRRQSHKERFPHPAITGQCQERVLRAEVGRLQELDQGKAGQDLQPEVPPRRLSETRPHGGQGQEAPRGPLLPVENGTLPTGKYLAWTTRRTDATCWWCQYHTQTRDHLFKHCPEWKNQQRTLWKTVSTETRKLPGPTRERHKTSTAELLAHRRCSQAVLDFLENTDVGSTPGPPVAEETDVEASIVS